MVYDVAKLLREVRVCLDQNMTSDALLAEADIDTLSLDEIVRSKVEEGARIVELSAPGHMLEQGHNFGDEVYWGDQCSGWTVLPEDFMRLVAFEMSDWERPVNIAISSEDPGYALQRQRVKALRGTPQRPVCAIVTRPEGLVLEFYSCRSEGATVTRAIYVPEPRVDTDGGIDISERCYRSVVYMAASLASASIGDVDGAKRMRELSTAMMI